MNDQYEDPLDPPAAPPPPPVMSDDLLNAARAAHEATNAPIWDSGPAEIDYRQVAKPGVVLELMERYRQAVAAAESALNFGTLPPQSTAHTWCREAVRRSKLPLEAAEPPAAATFRQSKPRPEPKQKPNLFSGVEEST